MIKLFTMVKDEVDIIEDWILYHGTLFGFQNLYIVDNMSSDGTYEVIQKYQKHGIHSFRHPNYKEKGNIMKQLINDNKCTIAFPLDIDEFIVYYDKEKRTISTDSILPYLHHLIKLNNNHSSLMNMPIHGVNRNCGLYKCNYINSKIISSNKDGYKRAALECTRGSYNETMKKMAKSFFDTRIWNGIIDHGNHCCTDNYIKSELCLVHYHKRNLEQHKKKVINNVKGLGYNIDNIDELKKLSEYAPGRHHIRHMIKILEGTYSVNLNEKSNSNDIDLSPISNFLKKLLP